MGDELIEEAERLIKITQEAHRIFDEYAGAVSIEILRARLKRDQITVDMLEVAVKSARANVEKMERQLGKALLSTALVDQVEGALKSKAKEAEDLVADMKQFGATLDKVKQGADIVTAALRTVSGIVV